MKFLPYHIAARTNLNLVAMKASKCHICSLNHYHSKHSGYPLSYSQQKEAVFSRQLKQLRVSSSHSSFLFALVKLLHLLWPALPVIIYISHQFIAITTARSSSFLYLNLKLMKTFQKTCPCLAVFNFQLNRNCFRS